MPSAPEKYCVILGVLLGPVAVACTESRHDQGRAITEVAEAYARARVRGDQEVILSLLVPDDSLVLTRVADVAPDALGPDLGFYRAGLPSTAFDSLSLSRYRGDTARVLLYFSEPNWSRIGGRYDSASRRDRATADPGLAASLPHVRRTRAINVIRVAGRWRVYLNVRDTLFQRAARATMSDASLPRHERIEAAKQLQARVPAGSEAWFLAADVIADTVP